MIKLTYFEARARVETARLMLELAGTPYEIEAISLATWIGPEGKERFQKCTPFGQLPLLRDDDLVLCQSRAIHRHLARKLELYGDSAHSTARVDEVYETADELFNDIALFHWNPQFHEARAQHRETLHGKLTLLQQFFTRTRADAEHWVLPGRFTLADVAMAYALESTLPLHPGLLHAFPALEHAMTALFKAPGIREYVRSDRRPRTFTIAMAQFGGHPEETHHWTD